MECFLSLKQHGNTRSYPQVTRLTWGSLTIWNGNTLCFLYLEILCGNKTTNLLFPNFYCQLWLKLLTYFFPMESIPFSRSSYAIYLRPNYLVLSVYFPANQSSLGILKIYMQVASSSQGFDFSFAEWSTQEMAKYYYQYEKHYLYLHYFYQRLIRSSMSSLSFSMTPLSQLRFRRHKSEKNYYHLTETLIHANAILHELQFSYSDSWSSF